MCIRDRFWAACRSIYERSLRFMLADPRNAAMCMSITRARAQLEGHPALLELLGRMKDWSGEIIRYGQSIGAVRTDLPTDLVVEMALSLMDAGDRWLMAHWDEITPDSVDATAETMVGLFRRMGAPEEKR